VGEPPLTGVAVNRTEVPSHIGPVGLEDMLTPAITVGLTFIVKIFDVTEVDVAQEALLPIVQEICVPFSNELSENVGLFVPTATPFFFQ
jgi:hypothetical protein